MRVLAVICAVVLLADCGRASHHAIAGAATTTTTSTTRTTAASAVTVQPPARTDPCGGTSPPPARYDHVIWIWMENHSRDAIIGNASAPYATSLSKACATARDYRSVGAPSLPNYIGATSGSTQGIGDDAGPSAHPVTADNIFRQVRAGGGKSRTYAESMSASCALVSSGRYAVRHNPAAYYVGDGDRSACAVDDVALGTVSDGPLADDLAHDTLPSFLMIIPDLCDDTHDCSVATGDRWLTDWVGAILKSPAYRSGSTAVFVLWDEPAPMPLLVIAPSVRPGTVITERLNHYAILRTTEEMLGITAHLGAAEQATSIRAFAGI